MGIQIILMIMFKQILNRYEEKSEVYSLKTRLRRVQVELDSLRNESIEDDIELTDETNDNNI